MPKSTPESLQGCLFGVFIIHLSGLAMSQTGDNWGVGSRPSQKCVLLWHIQLYWLPMYIVMSTRNHTILYEFLNSPSRSQSSYDIFIRVADWWSDRLWFRAMPLNLAVIEKYHWALLYIVTIQMLLYLLFAIVIVVVVLGLFDLYICFIFNGEDNGRQGLETVYLDTEFNECG